MTVTVDHIKKELGRAKRDANFETLFHTHWTRVYGVLFRLVGDPDEAEDLALEVFWRLYRQPPTDQRQSNLAGWLYRVATNLGFNALRARKRRTHYEQQAGAQAFAKMSTHNPAQEVERMDEREQVHRVLLKLKPRSAQLLILRYSGFSYAELADVIHVSPRSIGTLLARAEKEFEKQYRALEGAS